MTKHRIEKLSPTANGETRYVYRGWVIMRVMYSWYRSHVMCRNRTVIRAASNQWGRQPKVMWEVRQRERRDAGSWTFDHRRDAVAWIDEQEDAR